MTLGLQESGDDVWGFLEGIYSRDVMRSFLNVGSKLSTNSSLKKHSMITP